MIGNNMKKVKNNNSEAGFTLIESLTAVFVFAVIVGIIAAVFANSSNMFRRSSDLQKMQEDVAFILESMVREIRVSQLCNTGPLCSQQVLTIDHPVNGVVSYSLNTASNIIERNDVASGTIVEMSSDEVKFTKLDFLITGLGFVDDEQPKATIVMSVESNNDPTTMINIQTTVTSRDVREEFLNP
jgi:prepilin-type N-terminal cleavage/methylation domain-containing protein